MSILTVTKNIVLNNSYSIAFPVLALFLIATTSIHAIQITWTGDGDGATWSDADNWSPAQVPGRFDVVTFPSDADVVFTPSTQEYKILSLTVLDSAFIEFNFPFVVTGTFSVGQTDDLIITDTTEITFNAPFQSGNFFVQSNNGLAKFNVNENIMLRPSSIVLSSIRKLFINVAEDKTLVFNDLFGANSTTFPFGGPGSILDIKGLGNVAFAGGIEVGEYTFFTNNGNACYTGLFTCFAGNCTGNALTDPCSLIEPTVPFISGLKQPDSVIIQTPLIALVELGLEPDSLESNVFQFAGDSVLIDVIPFPNKVTAASQGLADLGMRNRLDNGDDTDIISGYIPIDSLVSLQSLEDCVKDIRPLYLPVTDAGVATSQGDFSQGSFDVRQAYGLTGEGYKIGVLSDSYAIMSPNNNDIATGDIPAAGVEVLEDLEGAGHASDEGRAMLQIIHDVAPGADLAFKTGFISPGNFAMSIRDLADADCDIIVDDITYVTEPFYKDGQVAQAVKDVSDDGVIYITSAGNYGNNSYSATFDTAITATLPAGISGKPHAFNGTSDIYQNITLAPGNHTVMLQWDDGFLSLDDDSAHYDLDIYLIDNDGVLRYAHNNVNIGKDPFEIMDFRVVGTAPIETNIVITLAEESPLDVPVDFKYIFFRSAGVTFNEYHFNNSTIVGQANTSEAISVGAVLYSNTPEYGLPIPTPASFSSRGGWPVDGMNRNKPDIMAPNGVNTTVDLGGVGDFDNDGLPNFSGTSAAAPHVAGAIALLMEGRQRFDGIGTTKNQALDSLQSTAIDMETAGYDVASGFGFLNMYSALTEIASPQPVVTDYSIPGGTSVGTQQFTLTIEGEYFTEISKVMFGEMELTTTVVDDTTLTAIVPIFPVMSIDTPLFVLNTAISNSLTDGGNSNEFFLDEVIKPIVTIAPVNMSILFGEEIPLNADFTYLIQGVDSATIVDNGLDMLNLVYTTDATPITSMPGLYAVQVELGQNTNPLISNFDFRFTTGALTINKLPITIQPDTICINYGEELPDITYEFTFEGNITNSQGLIDAIQMTYDSTLVDSVGVAENFQMEDLLSDYLAPVEELFNGLLLVNEADLLSELIAAGSLSSGATLADALSLVNGLSLVNNLECICRVCLS